MANHQVSLGSSWFDEPAALPSPSAPPASPAPAEGSDPRRAFALGALGGAFGAAAMVIVAAELCRRLRIDADVIGTVARSAHVRVQSPFVLGVGVAVAIGAVVGAVFGGLMRHTRRVVARLLAGVMLADVVWTLVRAFVLPSFAPASLGQLPFGPLLLGATLFGLCVGVARPPLRHRA